jgi:hypothetical protein
VVGLFFFVRPPPSPPPRPGVKTRRYTAPRFIAVY